MRRIPVCPPSLVLLLAVVAAACDRKPTRGYEVVAELPHDRNAYTQGLVYHDGVFYESTGRYGYSELRKVDPATGQPVQRLRLDDSRFGEGLAIHGDRLYQLTWKENVAYVYDLATLQLVDSLSYTGEGWGLASNGESLILSDGTSTLRFLDPSDFSVRATLPVTADGGALQEINELEMIRGELWANVYQTDYIVRIDPQTGRVLAWLDLKGLLPLEERGGTDVLNGIAWDSAGDRLFVTGKLWPKIYQIRLPEGTTG